MIKGKANQENGRELVILGISQENVTRLKEGKPIMVHGTEIKIPVDIMIYYGATDQDLVKQMRPAMETDTRIHRSSVPEHKD